MRLGRLTHVRCTRLRGRGVGVIADSDRRLLCGGVRVVLGARYVAACFLQVIVRRVRLRLSRGIVSRGMGLGPSAGARASTVTWSAVGGVPRGVSALNLL